MISIGLDAHCRRYAVAIFDPATGDVKSFDVKGSSAVLVRRLERWADGRRFQIAFEASTGYGVLYRRLSKVAHRVVVAHPGKLKLISHCKRKHDRVDAIKLAKLLAVGFLPARLAA